jgi:hypothetical protein
VSKRDYDPNAWRHEPIDLAKLARMAPFPGEFDRFCTCVGSIHAGLVSKDKNCHVHKKHR